MKITTLFDIGDWVWGNVQHSYPPNHYGEICYWRSPVKLQIHEISITTDGIHRRETCGCLRLVEDFPEGVTTNYSAESLFKTKEEWWDFNKGTITPEGMITGDFDELLFDNLERYEHKTH